MRRLSFTLINTTQINKNWREKIGVVDIKISDVSGFVKLRKKISKYCCHIMFGF